MDLARILAIMYMGDIIVHVKDFRKQDCLMMATRVKMLANVLITMEDARTLAWQHWAEYFVSVLMAMNLIQTTRLAKVINCIEKLFSGKISLHTFCVASFDVAH